MLLSSFAVLVAAALLLLPDAAVRGATTHQLGAVLFVLAGVGAVVQALVLTSRETEARQLRRQRNV